MSPQPTVTNILALDIGEKRIGVARANSIARLPQALTTLANDEQFESKLAEIIRQEDIGILVVGLPRNLHGGLTAQSEYVQVFCQQRLNNVGVPVVYQDETLTSVAAEEALGQRAQQDKSLIDAEAARLILQDYLGELS